MRACLVHSFLVTYQRVINLELHNVGLLSYVQQLIQLHYIWLFAPYGPCFCKVLFLEWIDADLSLIPFLFQVFPVLALFFCYMRNSLFRFWLGIKKVSNVLPSLERFKVIVFWLHFLTLFACFALLWFQHVVEPLLMAQSLLYHGESHSASTISDWAVRKVQLKISTLSFFLELNVLSNYFTSHCVHVIF
jgi:hypothetical protein